VTSDTRVPGRLLDLLGRHPSADDGRLRTAVLRRYGDDVLTTASSLPHPPVLVERWKEPLDRPAAALMPGR
jgi:hypothetical protein